ncbi:MAG: PQQ-binding-like beta-propeller repeat protein, partial [Candidatus Latescibacteria bacterium]|nr:PQQ-binding-like beta-propeller repeat protein [Candidatus Latescibacterota bacterium]
MCLAILSSAEAGETVGWRTDGTGVYADCQPPSKTGPEVNVAWKTPLPDWSNCTPIQVGDRIYITAEPYDVLCIDANGAGILWQKSNGFEDLESPSPEMGRKIQEEVEQEEALIKERKRIRKEQKKLERESKADTANAELKKQIKAKGKELGDIDKKRDALLLAGKVRKWPTHRSNGYSTRTLTSDGTHVFGAFGNGMVVCYDLDGNLKWHVQHKPIFHSWGGSTSPTLVEDRLIVHSDDHYFAHRASDGKELWRHEAPRAYGTPVVALVGETAVLVTPQGVLLDVQNGEQLGEPIFKPLPYNAPLVKDGVVYAVGRKDSVCIAIQLPESAESLEQGGAKVLWSKAVKKDRYYGSPVIDGEGLLYAITRNHVLTVLDTKTGDTVYEEKVPAIKGQSYMSPTLAGGNVYLNGEKGSLVVLKAGK